MYEPVELGKLIDEAATAAQKTAGMNTSAHTIASISTQVASLVAGLAVTAFKAQIEPPSTTRQNKGAKLKNGAETVVANRGVARTDYLSRSPAATIDQKLDDDKLGKMLDCLDWCVCAGRKFRTLSRTLAHRIVLRVLSATQASVRCAPSLRVRRIVT